VAVLLAAVSCVVLVITSSSRFLREKSFSDAAYKGAYGWQTSDNDTNMGFDCRPIPNRQVVPRYVLRMGELDQVFQA
jgi:hypothetical protein